MKKFITTVMSLAILVVNSITVFADDSKTIYGDYAIKNEYLEMKQLQLESASKLKKMGLKSTEIDEIKSLDVDEEYSKHIYSLKDYSESELEKFNYTDKQIELIKNFNGEIEELTLLGASCKTYISKTSYSYSNQYTKAVLNFSFKWSGVPYFKYNDCLTFAWNNGLYVDKSKSYLNVTYKGRYDSTMKQKATQNILSTGDAGVNYTFPVDIGTMNVSEGSGVVYLDKKANIVEIGTRVEYGHREVTGTPSASVSIGGGISGSVGISFDKKTKSISYNTARFKR